MARICFNLVIEYLLFSSKFSPSELGGQHPVMFQSRNRVSSLFKEVARRKTAETRPQCFNLVIEYLLFSRNNPRAQSVHGLRRFNLVIEYLLFSRARASRDSLFRPVLFQSRNRVSSLFKKEQETMEYPFFLRTSFNLVIEYLLFSSDTPCSYSLSSKILAMFQSRNRVSSLFKTDPCAQRGSQQLRVSIS